MCTRAAAGAAVVAPAAVLVTGASSSTPQWQKDIALITKGIARAQAAGRIDEGDAADSRLDVSEAARVLPKLPSSRYRNLAAVDHQVAGFWTGDNPVCRRI